MKMSIYDTITVKFLIPREVYLKMNDVETDDLSDAIFNLADDILDFAQRQVDGCEAFPSEMVVDHETRSG